MTAEPVLQVKNIHKAFGDRKILEGVSFDVYAGEMLGLIGPSGCGKSTLLKIICGLLAPDQGEVIRRSDDIGLVFQGSALLNSLTVRNNLALALDGRNLTKKEEDKGKFKVPGLRNVEVTAPYMHNGMFSTLEQVVDYYDNPYKFVSKPLNMDSLLIKPLNFTPQEKSDLVSFLQSLTDYQFKKKA